MKKLNFTTGCFDHGEPRIRRGLSYAKLLTILFALTIILFPAKAHSGVTCSNVSGDIEFVGTNFGDVPLDFLCGGPWLRSGGNVIPECGNDGAVPPCVCTFYAAAKDIFSPYGKWTCTVGVPPRPDTVLASAEFCVEKGDTKVNLEFLGSSGLTVDKPSPPCRSSVSSFLGDNFKQEKSERDSDEFLFDGASGDRVTLMLETNPQEGHNGGVARLGIHGDTLNESTSGIPPIELEVTLPASAEYSITVEQPKRPKDQRFRGSYLLSVTPTIGSIDLIEPTNNVEK